MEYSQYEVASATNDNFKITLLGGGQKQPWEIIVEEENKVISSAAFYRLDYALVIYHLLIGESPYEE